LQYCQVVGEIYDEDEAQEHADDSRTVFKDNKNAVFAIRGHATLEDVCAALNWDLEDSTKEEYATISGLLCAHAKHIPKPGEVVSVGYYPFTVVEVEDSRRIR
jgi:CBS domain containing-hemolysin-like protein